MVMMMEMDGFDRLPDSLILLIFNYVSDVKTLIRCRSISKRFNLLVPQTESLLLNVDCVISPDSDSDSLLFSLLRSLLKSLHHFLFYLPDPPAASSSSDGGKLVPRVPNSPAHILSCFHRIRHLRMQLPAGDLRLDKGVVVKWKAVFGNTLRSCVILGFRAASGSGEVGDDVEDGIDFAGGLKTRVVWTISALIAASARHFLLRDVVREHEGMERLVLVDREGEGTVVMEKDGLKECRLGAALRGGTEEWEMGRTVVPSVRMRMRHEPRVRLKNGVWAKGATLVVVRPSGGGDGGGDAEDAELAMGAFEEGPYAETVQVLLQHQSYLLEMNSF